MIIAWNSIEVILIDIITILDLIGKIMRFHIIIRLIKLKKKIGPSINLNLAKSRVRKILV
jgi:hypothetical protein